MPPTFFCPDASPSPTWVDPFGDFIPRVVVLCRGDTQRLALYLFGKNTEMPLPPLFLLRCPAQLIAEMIPPTFFTEKPFILMFHLHYVDLRWGNPDNHGTLTVVYQ